MYRSYEDNPKILLLQLRKQRHGFFTKISGSLAQKGVRTASSTANNTISQLRSDVARSNWKFAPRAKIAVSMRFFSSENQIPALHNLVKYYLDLLRAVVFQDDRQVEYLVAECWHPTIPPNKYPLDEGAVFIRVERLTEYNEKFDLYMNLLNPGEFKNYLKRDSSHRDLIAKFDYDDDFDDFFFDKPIRDKSLEFLPEETRETMRTLYEEETQKKLLSLNYIEPTDRPGNPNKHNPLGEGFPNIRDLAPFTVNLGDLPAKGEKSEYKQRIQNRVADLRNRHNIFKSVIIPVDLDVQVSPRHLSKLDKDLDNIMRDIAPALSAELFRGRAYLHGYRIYVAKLASESKKEGSIRIKLLPQNAISEFEDKMERVFSVAESWLEREL